LIDPIKTGASMTLESKKFLFDFYATISGQSVSSVLTNCVPVTEIFANCSV